MALFSKDAPNQQPRPQPRGNEPQPPFHGTFFGPNVTIDGTVSGSEAVLIEGTVRGKINLTNDLRIGTKARVEATVHAKNVTIELREAGRAWLARNGYDRAFGARPMSRLISSKIKEPLVDAILFGKLASGGAVVVDAEGNELRLDVAGSS